LANIIEINTAVPRYKHQQKDLMNFMLNVYQLDDIEKRTLRFLYHKSAIETRYSVIKDFSLCKDEWTFIPPDLQFFPTIDTRMDWYNKEALQLGIQACTPLLKEGPTITHLITVSCTGMSAPGLDILLLQSLNLDSTVVRTSINFMGCYAAIHALKMAHYICAAEKNAEVLIVCVELCTLHFQQPNTPDNISSSLLFADGAAAVLVSNRQPINSIKLQNFFSYVSLRGNDSMAWNISKDGFLMKLTNYVPQIIEEDIALLVKNSLSKSNLSINNIQHWCIHPGGRKILEAFEKSIQLSKSDLMYAYNILLNYGNMSSPTVLFVLQQIMTNAQKNDHIFGCAFGPGLTIETFTASVN
jgi:predicted naringenin-chalcone synthase